MNTMRSLKAISLSAAMLLVFAGCRKETGAEPADRDHTAAIDHGLAEAFFTDALKLSDGAAKGDPLPCSPRVDIDLSASPHTMLIDFGPDNCTGLDGWVRRGKLRVTFTGAYSATGTVITITPEDYHVNDHLVQGVKTVTNAGPNAQGQTHFNVAVDGTVTAPNGSWTSTHSARRVRTWISGEGTLTPFDDVYLITGNGSGTNRHGVPYTLVIITPLRVEVGCPWVVSGVLDITPGNLAVRRVDYGDGTCDRKITVTVNGFTITFNGG